MGRSIWDRFSPIYDVSETVYNGSVYNATGERVAEYIYPCDEVLECACGTGAISVYIASKCKRLTATDMSEGMLRQAERKLKNRYNVRLRKADITHLKCRDGSYDKVVAGNVIHLLDDPEGAVRELMRVCKPGGKVIIPTYINESKLTSRAAVGVIRKFGVDFKKSFTLDSYKQFFADMGYDNAEFTLVNGRMPCAIAVITKE
ncbi:MAG: class I SAM-dependent methyltransferase [Ruminococcus sp.]|nr:class I SAM-dependent methyltransferase [Ruminococcus sp.]